MDRNNYEWLKKINYWASLDEKIVIAYCGRIKILRYIKKNYIDKKRTYYEIKNMTFNEICKRLNSYSYQIQRVIKSIGINSWEDLKYLIINYQENNKEE